MEEAPRTWSESEKPTVAFDSPEFQLEPGVLVTEHLRLVRELGSGGMGSVWLAEHLALGVQVAVKFLLMTEAGRRDRLAREAQLAAKIDHPHAVRVLEFGESIRGPFLVMEFVAGESLQRRIARDGALDLASVRRLVAQVADVLTAAHAAGILHRDVKPANVMVVAGAGELTVKVVDFGIAKSLDGGESGAFTLPGTIMGTPAYMAPEQLIDGRPADAQADLWGLGVLAYEALVGRPAFGGWTRAAICAAMLLKRYERASAIVPALPPALDDWFERAFAIDAATRFDSASELAETFEAAALGNVADGRARKPRPARLRIPDKLFGREREVATLLRAFEQASHGRSRVLFVTGYSGIGKTSLVAEVEQTLVAGGATFVSGKFDQFNRETPYDTLIQAFRQLIRKALGNPAPTVDTSLADRTATLAGPCGRALIDVIPEIEQLIGPQPELGDASPEEARNRFQVALTRLVSSLATTQHPLVMFLDDLQWADLASIDLVTNLATDPSSRHVLFVGAYRDNEIDAAHPLTAALERLRSVAGAIDEIALGPLTEDAVLDLISATFPGASGRMRLAVVCHEKTHGNAFFLRRLLESLHEDGPLRFDHALGQWTWDLPAIEARAVTENVVDFVATEIRRMPEDARAAIQTAACIGDPFDLETLAMALGVGRAVALERLRHSLSSELVTPAAMESALASDQAHETLRVSFRFAHDRIRQAALSLMDEASAARVHRDIGRFLSRQLQGAERERRLFELVDHMNRGLGSGVEDAREGAELRELNLAAARRATRSAAFEASYRYLQHAMRHLGVEPWGSDYEQTLAIHVECARAAYLSGDHDAMETLVAAATANGRTVLDRVLAREVKLHAMVSQQRLVDAVQFSVGLLGELGVELPESPTPADIERAVGETLARLGGFTAADANLLPMAHDPMVTIVQRIQNDTMSSAYLAVPNLLPIMGCNIVRATLDHGVCKESPYGFAILGLVLSAGNLIDLAHATGQIALAILGRVEDRSVHPRTLHVIASFVRAFVEPVREAVEHERQAFRLAMDTGDFEYAGWALHTMVCDGFYAGMDLGELGALYDRSRAIMAHHRQIAPIGVTDQFGQLIANLTGKAQDPTRLTGPTYDEAAQMALFRQINYRGAAFVLAVTGAIARFLFRDLDGARAFADEHAEYADGAVATYNQVWFHEIRALSILGVVDPRSPDDVTAALGAIEANLAQLRTWHRFSPVNHDHRVLLVEAEIARVTGDDAAIALYDRALAASLENGFTCEAALARELAYRHHLACGRRELAETCRQEACELYARWGAGAKVEHLQGERDGMPSQDRTRLSGT